MPNLVVKPSSADGTALVAVWESRSSPGDLFFSGLCAYANDRLSYPLRRPFTSRL
jgi:hypothetical protein